MEVVKFKGDHAREAQCLAQQQVLNKWQLLYCYMFQFPDEGLESRGGEEKGRHVPISAQRKVGSKYLKIVTNDLMNERQAPPQAAQIHRKGINSLLSTIRVIPLKTQVLRRCLCAFSCSSL